MRRSDGLEVGRQDSQAARVPCRVSAIATPCSSRKTRIPAANARAVSLPRLPQAELETAWLRRLESLPRDVEATTLYAGRGAALGRLAAEQVAAPLFVLSAGLGIVGARTLVPAYGITVAGRSEDSIATRAKGGFDPAAWWRAVSAGPASTRIDDVFGDDGEGIVMLALSAPYAAMVGSALAGQSRKRIARLRIFGWRLHGVLPSVLHPSIMDYDGRLEAALPGTRTDFSQRALTHFAQRIVPLGNRDRFEHQGDVSRALDGYDAPERVKRPRAEDGYILAWLGRLPSRERGIGRLLRRLRDEGVACEQARFARLYRQSTQSREA